MTTKLEDFNSRENLNEILFNKANKKLSKLGTIIIGRYGGMAYNLFPERNFNYPYKIDLISLNKFEEVCKYFSKLKKYIEFASEFAENEGFEIISISQRDELKDKKSLEENIYWAGIGSLNISNLKQFDTFIEMAEKAQKTELKTKIEEIIKLGRKLK